MNVTLFGIRIFVDILKFRYHTRVAGLYPDIRIRDTGMKGVVT